MGLPELPCCPGVGARPPPKISPGQDLEPGLWGLNPVPVMCAVGKSGAPDSVFKVTARCQIILGGKHSEIYATDSDMMGTSAFQQHLELGFEVQGRAWGVGVWWGDTGGWVGLGGGWWAQWGKESWKELPCRRLLLLHLASDTAVKSGTSSPAALVNPLDARAHIILQTSIHENGTCREIHHWHHSTQRLYRTVSTACREAPQGPRSAASVNVSPSHAARPAPATSAQCPHLGCARCSADGESRGDRGGGRAVPRRARQDSNWRPSTFQPSATSLATSLATASLRPKGGNPRLLHLATSQFNSVKSKPGRAGPGQAKCPGRSGAADVPQVHDADRVSAPSRAWQDAPRLCDASRAALRPWAAPTARGPGDT